MQRTSERQWSRLHFRIVLGQAEETADQSNGIAWLRTCRERPSDRSTAKKLDELAPSHCLPRGSGQGTYWLKLAQSKGAHGFRHRSLSEQPMSALGPKQTCAVH